MLEPLHQAAGVVFKFSPTDKKHKILIVTSRQNNDKWLFPKGDIDYGETAKFTARKEVLEEAGIVGDVIGYLGKITYTDVPFLIDLRLFLIKFITESNKPYEKRMRKWVDFHEAIYLHHLGGKIRSVVRRARRIVRRQA